MSRIGNATILIPVGVEVDYTAPKILVKGPLGELQMNIDPAINLEIKDNVASFKRKNDLKKSKSLHGLTRALFANMVTGVQTGWSKKLELVGVGYRATSDG